MERGVKEVSKGKKEFEKKCRKVVMDSLMEFGFTKEGAHRIVSTDFMRHNIDYKLPNKIGRLVIDKGSIARAVKKA